MWYGVGFRKAKVYMEVPGGTIGGYFGAGRNVIPILLLYGAQLLANVIWPLLFFLQRAWGLSFVWLLLVFALALVTCIRFFKSSRWGGGLMMPYLAWLAFAAVLNFSIARLNPQ